MLPMWTSRKISFVDPGKPRKSMSRSFIEKVEATYEAIYKCIVKELTMNEARNEETKTRAEEVENNSSFRILRTCSMQSRRILPTNESG